MKNTNPPTETFNIITKTKIQSIFNTQLAKSRMQQYH